jgi:hypothetical protein
MLRTGWDFMWGSLEVDEGRAAKKLELCAAALMEQSMKTAAEAVKQLFEPVAPPRSKPRPVLQRRPSRLSGIVLNCTFMRYQRCRKQARAGRPRGMSASTTL